MSKNMRLKEREIDEIERLEKLVESKRKQMSQQQKTLVIFYGKIILRNLFVTLFSHFITLPSVFSGK